MKSWTGLSLLLVMMLFCRILVAQNKHEDSISSVENNATTQKIKADDNLKMEAGRSAPPLITQQSAANEQNTLNEAETNELRDLVKAIWSGIAALILLPLSYLTKRYFDKFYEKKRIIDELRDLYRHFDRNREVLTKILQTIETTSGKLAPIHLQKLKVIETSTLLFQTETLRNIDSRYVQFLSRLKIGLRNANIEADGAISFLTGDNYNLGTMKEYLTLLQDRSTDHQVQIKKILDTLGGEIPGNEARLRELVIIYHPLLSDKAKSEDPVSSKPIVQTGIKNGRKS